MIIFRKALGTLPVDYSVCHIDRTFSIAQQSTSCEANRLLVSLASLIISRRGWKIFSFGFERL